MKRTMYDLSHQIHTCGEIGRLQTLAVIDVVGGDSLELNVNGLVRMAPTRKEVVQDAKLDIFCFYRPHRHTYGQDWIDLIRDGVDNSVSLTDTAITATGDSIEYLAQPVDAATIPTWLVNGYWDIYNWYFKNPDDPDTVLTKIPSDAKERQYGTLISRLPHPMTRPRTLNTGLETDLEDSDAELNVGSGTLDVRELSKVSAEYKQEIDTNWYANRYPDIMEANYGSTVSEETDERPKLIWRESGWMSGKDMDGFDDATLGDIQGKTLKRINFSIPRKFYPEHGAVWIMATLRFPPIHVYEQKFSHQFTPSYARNVGNREFVGSQPPERFDIDRYIANGSNFTDSDEPYGQWYRYHPNRVHTNYRNIPGYPFLESAWSSMNECYYHQAGEYDNVFHTWQLGHWQMNLLCDCKKLTVVPGIDESINVGVGIGS